MIRRPPRAFSLGRTDIRREISPIPDELRTATSQLLAKAPLSPVLGEEETLPDMSVQIELYGRKLQGYCEVMVATDETYLAEIARLDEVQAEAQAPMR